MVRVNLLATRGVAILIAGGMGKRPLAGFAQTGIDVYQEVAAAGVGQAIDAFLSGSLTRFSPHSSCGNPIEGECYG
jgi:predicted Fe-Mo cluster-binding NifX family protein